MITFIAVVLLAILFSPFVGFQMIIDGKKQKDSDKTTIGYILLIVGLILCECAFN